MGGDWKKRGGDKRGLKKDRKGEGEGEIRGKHKRLGECGETMKDAVKIKRLPLITSSK